MLTNGVDCGHRDDGRQWWRRRGNIDEIRLASTATISGTLHQIGILDQIVEMVDHDHQADAAHQIEYDQHEHTGGQ